MANGNVKGKVGKKIASGVVDPEKKGARYCHFQGTGRKEGGNSGEEEGGGRKYWSHASTLQGKTKGKKKTVETWKSGEPGISLGESLERKKRVTRGGAVVIHEIKDHLEIPWPEQHRSHAVGVLLTKRD